MGCCRNWKRFCAYFWGRNTRCLNVRSWPFCYCRDFRRFFVCCCVVSSSWSLPGHQTLSNWVILCARSRDGVMILALLPLWTCRARWRRAIGDRQCLPMWLILLLFWLVMRNLEWLLLRLFSWSCCRPILLKVNSLLNLSPQCAFPLGCSFGETVCDTLRPFLKLFFGSALASDRAGWKASVWATRALSGIYRAAAACTGPQNLWLPFTLLPVLPARPGARPRIRTSTFGSWRWLPCPFPFFFPFRAGPDWPQYWRTWGRFRGSGRFQSWVWVSVWDWRAGWTAVGSAVAVGSSWFRTCAVGRLGRAVGAWFELDNNTAGTSDIVWLVSAGIVDQDHRGRPLREVLQTLMLLQAPQCAVYFAASVIGALKGSFDVIGQSASAFGCAILVVLFVFVCGLFQIVLDGEGGTSSRAMRALSSACLSCSSSLRMVSV